MATKPQQQSGKEAQRVSEPRERVLELEEQLRRQNEFLGTLAHELRNPLAPVRNSLHMLKLLCSSDTDVQESLAVIDRQIHAIVRLIDEIHDVSRLSRGTLRLQKVRTSLAEVVDSAVGVSRGALDAAKQVLSLNLPANSVYVDADRARLLQAFTKLLQNAAKYSEPGGRVTVGSELTDECVTIRFSDTGIGIEPGKLESIFDLFVQLDDPRARTRGGLGVGLPLAREIIRLHGGTIEARSPGSGQGSDLLVKLPLAST